MDITGDGRGDLVRFKYSSGYNVEKMYRHDDPGGVGKAVGVDVYETPEFYDWFDTVRMIE